MPSIEWNKQRWTSSLQIHEQDPSRNFAYGDQWGTPETAPPLKMVRDAWLMPFVGPERTILEIGSGGGRWTQLLLNARKLYSVDINQAMIQYLQQRFGTPPQLALIQTAGADLPGVPERSIDFVFSFGTFVHLEPETIAEYLQNIRPLLKPGADVVIQYSDKTKPIAANNPHFAATDSLMMEAMFCKYGYRVIRHDTQLLVHSNIIHVRPAPDTENAARVDAWPLATDAPVRLLAWPDYRSAEEVFSLFQTYVRQMVNKPICLCLRRDRVLDPSPEVVEQILQEAFRLTVKNGDIEILVIDEEIPSADWIRLGAGVDAVISLPSSQMGVRASWTGGVGAPRVTHPNQIDRLMPT
ncbi:MAG: class I SAM-dependent methyltransferase [Myxococcota bacterium]